MGFLYGHNHERPKVYVNMGIVICYMRAKSHVFICETCNMSHCQFEYISCVRSFIYFVNMYV